MLTGNPVRQDLLQARNSREESLKKYGLLPTMKTVLIVGGSLGARTMNESVLQHLDQIKQSNVQFIWQTGKYYYNNIKEEMQRRGFSAANLVYTDFLDMLSAYRAADLVVSRAGASSISEICLLGKPAILVPSPNVAEDHQTKNAMALVNRQAAIFVSDAEASEKLVQLAIETVSDDAKLEALSKNVLKMALPNSAEIIAKEVIALAQHHNTH